MTEPTARSEQPSRSDMARAELPARMRVGVITARGAVEIREVALPRPGPGEVLVRQRAVAVCTLEQRVFRGTQSIAFPFLGGHEIAGEVVEVGPGILPPLAVGTRVAVSASACGRCHACLTGQDRFCARHYGGLVRYEQAWGPGGFAEYKLHPADGVYEIGDATFDEAALCEPLGCAVHAARMLEVGVARDAVVLGAGSMGLLNVIALKKRGARVLLVELDAGRLERARRVGADETIDAGACDPVARVKELTEGRGADFAVAAAGGGTVYEQGLAMLTERGRFALFASSHPEAPVSWSPNYLHNKEVSLIGTISQDRQDAYTSARLLRYRQVDLSPILETAYPLSELEMALEHAARPGSYRVVVRP